MSRFSPLARLAAGAVAGVLLACTAVVTQAAAVAPYLEAQMHHLEVGQDQHSAFPGMTREPSGVLRLVWRQGSTHLSYDGAVASAESWDDGATWTNVQTVKVNLHRDPYVTSIDGINFMTWFGASPSNPAMGVAVQRDWWDYSRRIDALPQAAISAPIVKLPDGRLAAPFYGRKPGETLWTAWMGWSSDNGWSWSTNRIINEQASGMSTAEPYLVVNGPTTHMLVRWGDNAIGIRSSTNSGNTGSWDAPRKILDNATGRPTTVVTANGTMVMVYREASTKNAAMAYSTDNGATWQTADTVLAAPAGSPHGMTYATMVPARDDPNRIRVVVGMEQPDGSSDLWGGTVVLP